MAVAAKVSPFAIFRNRRFRLLWLAQLVSSIGDSLVDIAAAIYVYQATGSALAVGGVLMATAAPSLVFGLFAGVFVDRYDRKWIMVGCDLLRGVFVLSIPFILTFGVGWIYVAVAVVSAIGTFFYPAHSSVLPEIADDAQLAAANSMLAISGVGARAVGLAAGGFIAAAAAIGWAFYIDSLTFFLSAALISRIAIPAHDKASETSSQTVLHNLRTGLAYIWERDLLRSLVILAAGVTLTAGFHSGLQLPFAIEALGASEAVYGMLQSAAVVAFVMGAFFMAARASRLREGQWLTIALIGMASANVVFSTVTSIPIAIAMAMVAGLLMAPYGISGRLMIQRQTTREIRGRVSSTFGVVQNVTFLIGFALVGLADFFDIRLLYLIASLGVMAMGVVSAVMPGLGQPAAEWRRAVKLLRGAAAAPGLQDTRAATADDYATLAGHLPAMGLLSAAEVREFAAETLVAHAPAGTVVVRRGEASDAGYFVIEGRVVAGWVEEGRQQVLETLSAGDFFGEIAALTGTPRTASIIADEDTRLLQVPAPVLRRMSANQDLHRLFLTKMTERMMRMDMVDLPQMPGIGADALRELRTGAPRTKAGDEIDPVRAAG